MRFERKVHHFIPKCFETKKRKKKYHSVLLAQLMTSVLNNLMFSRISRFRGSSAKFNSSETLKSAYLSAKLNSRENSDTKLVLLSSYLIIIRTSIFPNLNPIRFNYQSVKAITSFL